MARDVASGITDPPPGDRPGDGEGTRDRTRPLYLTIAEMLQNDVAAGRFEVHSMLPTETELCRRFGVSRYTVREALRRLTELGLVQRRAGAGSIVIAAEPPKTFVHRVVSLPGLLKYPANTYRQRTASGTVRADRELAALIECEPGQEWFFQSAIRRSDDVRTPICSVDVYIPPDLAGGLDLPEIDRDTIYNRIESRFGIEVHRTEIRIFASGVRAPLADLLEVPAGAPALTLVRVYFDRDGRRYLATISVHPEHRFVYTMDLTRDV